MPVVIAPSCIFVVVIAPSSILSDDKVPFTDTPSFSEPIVNVPVILAALTNKLVASIWSAVNFSDIFAFVTLKLFINALLATKSLTLIISDVIAPACKKPTFSDFCQLSLPSPLPVLNPTTPTPSLSLSS